ncbi:MAG: MarR family winged helix-turn-helix transcriptional regulator [Sandaracinaceae bacterium]
MEDPPLSSFRRGHIGRAMFRALAAFQSRFADEIRARGFEDFRHADVEIIARLPVEGGARITEIAERSPISKQAVGKLVKGLEARGYVTRRPDPEDGRASRIVLTDRGVAFLRAGMEVVSQIESDWSAHLGGSNFTRLRRGLLNLSDTFGDAETL